MRAYPMIKHVMTILTCVLFLSSCVGANVTSFYDQNALLAGRTFAILPLAGQKNNLEFKQYARIVTQKLQEKGYILAPTIAQAYYGVHLRYSINRGQQVIVTRPAYDYYTGWPITDINSYKEYTRVLSLDIFKQKTGEKVYEGHVKSSGESDIFAVVGQCLIDALFKRFPGENGKTAFVTVSSDCIGAE